MSSAARIAWVTVAILAAIVGGLAVRGAPSRTASRAAAATLPPVGRIAHRVELVRGLRFRYVPKVQLVSAETLSRTLSRREAHPGAAARRAAREGLAAEGVAALAGILRQQDVDQAASGGAGAGADVGGVYVPADKRIYLVRDTVEKSSKLTEIVLAHELTHALEDQHFHDFSTGTHPFADSASARQALLEGSATLTELRYGQRYLHESGDLGALLAKRARNFAGPGVPAALRDAEAFPYVAGGRFVASLHGHRGWKLVDFAHRHPPRTTEAVLHPAGWHGTDRQRRPRFGVEKPLAAGWSRIARADVGEMDTVELLRTGLDEADARRGAAGWDAGSFETWSPQGADLEHCKLPCRSQLASVLVWRWDTPHDATEYVALMRRAIARALHAKPDGRDGFALDGGAAALRAYGRRRTALAYAPTLAQARQLLRSAQNG